MARSTDPSGRQLGQGSDGRSKDKWQHNSLPPLSISVTVSTMDSVRTDDGYQFRRSLSSSCCMCKIVGFRPLGCHNGRKEKVSEALWPLWQCSSGQGPMAVGCRVQLGGRRGHACLVRTIEGLWEYRRSDFNGLCIPLPTRVAAAAGDFL